MSRTSPTPAAVTVQGSTTVHVSSLSEGSGCVVADTPGCIHRLGMTTVVTPLGGAPQGAGLSAVSRNGTRSVRFACT